MYLSEASRRNAAVLNVIQREDKFVALTHQNLLVLIWSGPQDAAVCSRLYGIAVRVAVQSNTGKAAVVSLIVPGGEPPSREARDALARLHEDPKRVIHRLALVVLVEGFLAAACRSIVLGIVQRVSHRTGYEVFQRLESSIG